MTDPDQIDLSDCDPVLAEAIKGMTDQQATDRVARDPSLHGFARMRTFDPQRKPEHAAFIRKLMHAANAPHYCENPLCKRAGRCMDPKVRCFWENFDLMQRVVFPAMQRKLKERQARGEYAPDEHDAAPVSNASKSKR